MENDRVSYSFGMKLSGPGKYESTSFSLTLTSDVKEEETAEEALKRVTSFVEDQADVKLTELRNAYGDISGKE